MVIVQVSREMLAPLDKVWDIVSDIDNEPLYWHGTKYIKNISKIGNIIEREVVIAFRKSRCRETVVLDPKKLVKVNMTNGPLEGSKTITINSTGLDKTTVHVKWDIRLSGFMRMFTVVIKKHITEGTEEALYRIASETERIQ